MTAPHTFEPPPPFQLARMAAGLWIPQSIYAAATLGVADALGAEAKASAEIARAVGAQPELLRRLLRALVVLGIVTQEDDDRFRLTALGDCLRSDSPDSVRSWALLMGGPLVWRSWQSLVDCIRTGKTAPELLDGIGTFEQLEANPAELAVFNQAMVELTRQLAGVVAFSYDFNGIRTLVDVGGGHGALLPPILMAYPELRGIVFDLPFCRDGAKRLLAEAGVADRADFVDGSFFESVPEGADAYLLKSIIHDWNDERSTAILQTCRRAMSDTARLLLVEIVVPERLGNTPLDAMIAGTDLNMLVNAGGRERSEAEYRRLLEGAGFRLERIVATPAALSVIDARRA